jgi:hypothetical protein
LDPQPDIKKHHRDVLVVGCSGLVAMAGLIVLSSRGLFYDEEAHLGSLRLLRELGLTNDFLRQLLVTTGPLLPVLQYLASSVTGSSLLGLRLLNLPFICGAIYFLHLLFRRTNQPAPLASASTLLALPLIWMVSGIVFTEPPTLLFLSLGLLLVGILTKRLNNVDLYAVGRAGTLLVSAGAGLCSGFAFAGRQTALPVLLAAPLLALKFGSGRFVRIDKSRITPIITFISVGALIPAWLIWVWKGPTPPSHYFVNEGIRIEHGLMNFAFAGAMFILLAPRLMKLSVGSWIILFSSTTVINAAMLKLDIWFLTRIARIVLPAGLLPAYKYASTGLLLGLGLGCLICLIRAAWCNRLDPLTLYATAVTFMILAEAAKITFVYTYRYTVTAAPFMIWLASKYSVPNRLRLGSLALAQLLDLLFLATIP